MGISPFDYEQMRRRLEPKSAKDEHVSKGVAREADLHEEIQLECNRRGWLALHGSMAHKAHRTVGEPDFVILADGGRVILVEAKADKGKLSKEQQALAAWAKKLGHTVHVVRNMAEFLKAVR